MAQYKIRKGHIPQQTKLPPRNVKRRRKKAEVSNGVPFMGADGESTFYERIGNREEEK